MLHYLVTYRTHMVYWLTIQWHRQVIWFVDGSAQSLTVKVFTYYPKWFIPPDAFCSGQEQLRTGRRLRPVYMLWHFQGSLLSGKILQSSWQTGILQYFIW